MTWSSMQVWFWQWAWEQQWNYFWRTWWQLWTNLLKGDKKTFSIGRKSKWKMFSCPPSINKNKELENWNSNIWRLWCHEQVTSLFKDVKVSGLKCTLANATVAHNDYHEFAWLCPFQNWPSQPCWNLSLFIQDNETFSEASFFAQNLQQLSKKRFLA